MPTNNVVHTNKYGKQLSDNARAKVLATIHKMYAKRSRNSIAICQGWFTAEEVAKANGSAKGQVQRHLNVLSHSGIIQTRRAQGRTVWTTLYRPRVDSDSE